MAAMDRMDSQEIEEDELSDLETAIDNVTDRLSIFLDQLDPSTIMLTPEDESKDFDLKLTNPDSPVKAMEFELQMKSLVETVHINREQTLHDSSNEDFSGPIQLPDTPPDTPITSPTFSDDPVKEEADKIFSCNTFVFGPKGHFLAQTTAKDNSPLAKKVVEVMTAVTDKLSEMSEHSGFEMVNEEYTLSDDSIPNIMAVESSVIEVHSQPPITRQISDVSDDLEDLAKECKTDVSSSSDGDSEREDSPQYITPVLLLPSPPPQRDEEELTPRSDDTSTSSYSESYSECDSCKAASTGHVHVDLLLPSTIDEDECRSEVTSDVEMEPPLMAESVEDDPGEEVDIPMLEVDEVQMVESVPSMMVEEPSLDTTDEPSLDTTEEPHTVPSVVLETPSFEDDAAVSIDLDLHSEPSIDLPSELSIDQPSIDLPSIDLPSMAREPSIDLDNIGEPTIDLDPPTLDVDHSMIALDNLSFEDVQIKLTEPSLIMEDQNTVNGYSDFEQASSADQEPSSADQDESSADQGASSEEASSSADDDTSRPRLSRVETIDSMSSSSSDSESAELTMPVLSEAELDILRAEVVLGTPVEPTPSPEVPGDDIIIEEGLAMDIHFPVHVENGDTCYKEEGEGDGDEGVLDDGRRFSEVMRIPDEQYTPDKEPIVEEGLETNKGPIVEEGLEAGVVVIETERNESPVRNEEELRITSNAAIPCVVERDVPCVVESDVACVVPSTLDIDPLEDSLGLVTPCDVTATPCDVTATPCDVTTTPCDVTATPTLKAEIDAKLRLSHQSSSDDSLSEEELSPEFKSILEQMTSSAAEDHTSLRSDSSCSDSSRSTVENVDKDSVPLEMSNDLLTNAGDDMKTPEPELERQNTIEPEPELERQNTIEPEVEAEVQTPVPEDTPHKVIHPVHVKHDMHNDNTIEYDSSVDQGSQFSLDPPLTKPKHLDTSIILDDNNVSMTRSPNTTLNTTTTTLSTTLGRENKLHVKSKVPGKDPRVGKSFYIAFKLKMEGFNIKGKDVVKNAEVELWREGIKLSIIPKFKKGYFLYKIRNCSLRDSGMYIFKAKMLDYAIQCAEDVNVIEKGTRRSKSTTSIGSLGSLGSILSLNKNRNQS